MNVSGCGLSKPKATISSADVDQRVEERDALEAAEGDHGACAASSPSRAQRLVGLRRPASISARPPRERVVLGVGDDLGARRASQAMPSSITSWWGRQTSASTVIRSAVTDHSSRSSRPSVSAGFSPALDGAAGAERPAPRPGREPAGAAPGEPAPVAARARRTVAATLCAASARSSRSAQRTGSSSRTQPLAARPRRQTRRAERPSCAGEPRSRSALIAASAASVAGARRLVGRVAPVHLDLVERPRAAREDAGVSAMAYRLDGAARGVWSARRSAAARGRPAGRASAPTLGCVHEQFHGGGGHGIGLGGANGSAGGRGRGRGTRVLGSGRAAAGAARSRARARRPADHAAVRALPRRLGSVSRADRLLLGAQHDLAVPAARRARPGASPSTT